MTLRGGEVETDRGAVMFVDDEQDMLDGLCAGLRREPYELLTATSGAACLELLELRPVDVVVADEKMPGMQGSELLARVAELHPATVRIILTGRASVGIAIRAINEGGIFRFLEKPCPPTRLKQVLRDAIRLRQLNGVTTRMLDLVREESERLNGHWTAPPRAERAAASPSGLLEVLDSDERRAISPREREVLELIVAGERVAAIAKALFISPHTVRNHLKSIFAKLGVHSQVELRQRFNPYPRLPGPIDP